MYHLWLKFKKKDNNTELAENAGQPVVTFWSHLVMFISPWDESSSQISPNHIHSLFVLHFITLHGLWSHLDQGISTPDIEDDDDDGIFDPIGKGSKYLEYWDMS